MPWPPKRDPPTDCYSPHDRLRLRSLFVLLLGHPIGTISTTSADHSSFEGAIIMSLFISDDRAHPLIESFEKESGVNDMLDRDGSRTPIQFHISNDRDKHPIDAQVVQAATKWKRMALKQFECRPGEGICTDMRAVRKDYFLDHDHSAYVDQWDWERVITAEQRNLEFLKEVVSKIWKV